MLEQGTEMGLLSQRDSIPPSYKAPLPPTPSYNGNGPNPESKSTRNFSGDLKLKSLLDRGGGCYSGLVPTKSKYISTDIVHYTVHNSHLMCNTMHNGGPYGMPGTVPVLGLRVDYYTIPPTPLVVVVVAPGDVQVQHCYCYIPRFYCCGPRF
jgi:hypothetical protein